MTAKPEWEFELSFYEGILKRRPDYVDALIPLAEIYTRLGRYREGLELDKKLSRLCGKDPVVHYNLACSFALVGDADKSLEALTKAIQYGYNDENHMRKDPDLKLLFGEPRFLALVAALEEKRARRKRKE